jgi:hypothetical protein
LDKFTHARHGRSVRELTDEPARNVVPCPVQRALPSSITLRVNDIKDLIDDLVRLQQRGDPSAVEMPSHIKLKIDALVRAFKQARD